MPKAGPKRPKHQLLREITETEFANALFDYLAARPSVARAQKEAAEADGIPFEVVAKEVLAAGYRLQHKPLPPELREYITRHDPNMRRELYAILLKPDVQ